VCGLKLFVCELYDDVKALKVTYVYVSIRQHTSAYVSIRLYGDVMALKVKELVHLEDLHIVLVYEALSY
jgi:hypothetical protein